jgi:hypothetical protein
MEPVQKPVQLTEAEMNMSWDEFNAHLAAEPADLDTMSAALAVLMEVKEVLDTHPEMRTIGEALAKHPDGARLSAVLAETLPPRRAR